MSDGEASVPQPVPTRLGKYQLLRPLASGGMAELFLARAIAGHGFEKRVVLKRILPRHARDEAFVRLFLAEARLVATLHHPNIAQVYDFGEEAETHFFTMEYVEGQDLRALVGGARRQGVSIPLEHILQIGIGVAAGLHYAHEKAGPEGPLGIVHRDVSPSNVLVTYEGDVKLIDFGIAEATSLHVATPVGGKVGYMSPEQCRGEPVDRRSDIFAAGTILWELTTGKRLFGGEPASAAERVRRAEVPPPSSVRENYPLELEAIVMRALQARPQDRHPSAIDLQLELEDFARDFALPVSSARLGRFMKELFAEEIARERRDLQETQEIRLESHPVGARRDRAAEDDRAGAGPVLALDPEPTEETPGATPDSSDAMMPSEPPVTSAEARAQPGSSATDRDRIRSRRARWGLAIGLTAAAAVFAQRRLAAEAEPIAHAAAKVRPAPRAGAPPMHRPEATSAEPLAGGSTGGPPLDPGTGSSPAPPRAAPAAEESVEAEPPKPPIASEGSTGSTGGAAERTETRRKTKRRPGAALDLDAPLPPDLR